MKGRLGLALLLLVAVRPCFAWGCAGHRVAAYIALAHLQPAVRTRVNAILAADPVAVRRRPGCEAQNIPPMVLVSSWADDVRTPTTAPNHFVNIPAGARRARLNYAQICAGQCVTAAIARDRALVRQMHLAPTVRAAALRNLIHFVADVFQPLHASDDRDEGGNCVETRVMGARRTNLHADWDTVFLEDAVRRDEPTAAHPLAAFARLLDRHFGRRYAGGSMSPQDWAWESHGVADTYIFQALRLRPGCRRRPIRLNADYVDRVTPVMESQLDRAGWRLAAELNADLAR